MTTHIPRIGFACKFVEETAKGIESVRELNTQTTTVAWLGRQTKDDAEQRLWDIMQHNISAMRRLVERVGSLEPHLRIVRLSSDALPVYTHHHWNYFWRKHDVRNYCEKHLGEVGVRARDLGVRLSFHPGQFCVLASDSPDIVDRSIEEFEYHCDMIRWMGFGQKFQDFKCNVHISGRQGPEGIRAALKRMSPEARNTITIENEEITWGLDDCLQLSEDVAIVMDVHHHWVNTGEYIDPADARVQQVIDSWRGERPVMHYSISREDLLVGHCTKTMPDYKKLLASGCKRGKLRAHSDFYWNHSVNQWAGAFLDRFDIMCESKSKNLASIKFAEQVHPVYAQAAKRIP